MDPQSFDKREALNTVLTAVAGSRQILLDYFGHLSKISEKDKAGLVTEADVASEKNLQEVLSKNFPDIEFLGEEGSYKNQDQRLESQNQWIVDPLDGTTNYVHGFPVFCISVCLKLGGEMVLGVIDAPQLGQTFTANSRLKVLF